MAATVRDGVAAGALGFTTSRTFAHRTSQGAPLAPVLAARTSCWRSSGRWATGSGVVQLISDAYLSEDVDFATEEMPLMRSLVEQHGPAAVDDRAAARAGARPLAGDGGVGRRRRRRRATDAHAGGAPPDRGAAGLAVIGQPRGHVPVVPRDRRPPLADQVAALGDPERRQRIIEEHASVTSGFDGLASSIFTGFDRLFPMGDPVDYEPDPSQSVAARAAARGADPVEVMLDLMVEHDGRQLLYMTLFNYANGNLDDVREMLLSPNSVIGLSDAGAHCGAICDGSFPTTALALWTNRRPTVPLPVELMVHHLTQRTARQVGWLDRGVLAPGHLGDVNLIDLDRLAAHRPHIVRDLPAGGRRLMQSASGYLHTFKRGVVTFADGQATGDQPGRLVRGARPLAYWPAVERRLQLGHRLIDREAGRLLARRELPERTAGAA